MNSFSSGKNWQLSLTVTVLLISGITALQAQVPAGPSRPPSVPEGYVATPMGYFHESCVQELAEGDILHKDEKAIEHKDGSFDSVHSCAFPRYTPTGEKVPLDGEGPAVEEKAASDGVGPEPPAIAHDYIVLATMKNAPSQYYGELKATWIVPPDPVTHSNQIIYLFPGLQDYHTSLPNLTILQPVLGWNVVFPHGPHFPNVWSLSSWNCCVNGTVQHSTFIPTAAGHTIFGAMVCTTPGAPRCGSFNVTTYDQSTNPNKMTELKQTSSFGQYFNWAFAGALEVYNISQCSEYPGGSNGSTEFYYLGLYDESLIPVTQGWTISDNWTVKHDTPVCNYGGSSGIKGGLHEITLKY